MIQCRAVAHAPMITIVLCPACNRVYGYIIPKCEACGMPLWGENMTDDADPEVDEPVIVRGGDVARVVVDAW